MTTKKTILARTPAALAITVGALIVGGVFVFQGFTFLPVIGIFLGVAVMWWGVKAGSGILRLTEETPTEAQKTEFPTAKVSPSAATTAPDVRQDDEGLPFPIPEWNPSAGQDKVETIPSGS